jgi:Reverse transcriptase (RNA-dependent DNA polymerase)
LNEIPNNITFEEFKKALSKWNEWTTTSPSGCHLGHYKLLLRLPVFETDQSTINISQETLYVYYQVMMIAARRGITLDRWCNVSTVMIEKIQGNPGIDKLQIIHLYEADYNLLLKIVWERKAIWNAHNKSKIYEGQAGSRPNQRAIDVVLKKEMTYTYARLTRTMLGTIDKDAKSCFDRIVCNFAMLISRYYGISKNFCSTQAKTLQATKFRLQTALGDSSRTYQHTDSEPIHGTGQGSCASPAIWLLASSFLMHILQKVANGMKIHDVLKENDNILQLIMAFVDDTSIFTNDNEQDTKTLKQKHQEDGLWWAGLLESSGGKLELSKCFYLFCHGLGIYIRKPNTNGYQRTEQSR